MPTGPFVYVFMPTGPVSYACGLLLLYLGPSPFLLINFSCIELSRSCYAICLSCQYSLSFGTSKFVIFRHDKPFLSGLSSRIASSASASCIRRQRRARRSPSSASAPGLAPAHALARRRRASSRAAHQRQQVLSLSGLELQILYNH